MTPVSLCEIEPVQPSSAVSGSDAPDSYDTDDVYTTIIPRLRW